jgi:hypothetical protein
MPVLDEHLEKAEYGEMVIEEFIEFIVRISYVT